MSSMEAVILCGGLGTRLREETEFRPKPMVEIGDKPILWHIMRRYAAYGVKRFILCLGYKGDDIRNYFLSYRYYKSDFSINLATGEMAVDAAETEDWEVVLAETGDHSLTGSRIGAALKHVRGERFFATYGDGVADVDIDALLHYHLQSGKGATLTSVLPPSRFGEITTKNGTVEYFTEKPQVATGAINGGFFVFEKAPLQAKLPRHFQENPRITLEGDVLSALAKEGKLAAYEHKGFWQCMDTHREMELLNAIYNKGNPPWLMKDGTCLSGAGNGSSSPDIPASSAAG